MTVVIASQARAFLLSILIGASLSLIYDIFRLYRITLSVGTFGVFMQDTAFWLISGSTVLLFSMSVSSGEIRGYLILAMLLGSFVYFRTLSGVIVGKFGAILRRMRKKASEKAAIIASKCKKHTDKAKKRAKKLKKHFKKRKNNSIIKSKKKEKEKRQ